MNWRLIFRIILILLLCAVCFFAGAMIHVCLSVALKQYGKVAVLYSGNEGSVTDLLLFLFFFATLPVLIICLWKYIPVYSSGRRTWSVLIILISITFLLYLRTYSLIQKANALRNDSTKRLGNFRFPGPVIRAEELNYWMPLTGALLMATGLIYLLLRERPHAEQVVFSFENNGGKQA